MYRPVYICMHICIHAYTHRCTCKYIIMYVCMYIYIIYVYMYMCIHIYVRMPSTKMRTCTQTHLCIHVHACSSEPSTCNSHFRKPEPPSIAALPDWLSEPNTALSGIQSFRVFGGFQFEVVGSDQLQYSSNYLLLNTAVNHEQQRPANMSNYYCHR